MWTIKYTNRFKRDYKREKKSGYHRATLDTDLLSIVKLLAADKPLPPRNRDHPLATIGKITEIVILSQT